MIIAIDGPAAAGKGTLARRLAAELGFAYLDTGLLYRAVGIGLKRAGGEPDNKEDATMAAQRVTPACLQDPALRSDEAGQLASKAAIVPGVRAALLEFQRDFARTPPGGAKGAVLDGRDIGTVVCPNAACKIFVTGSLEVRAARRAKELRERGEAVIDERVLQEMRERDERDTRRSSAPLVPARDAFVLDTSDMNAEEAFQAALAHVRSRMG
ncbi:MAG: (d)CMP kinase [Alphaproteobacteria bacterium]|nr:(d)CMP kinase [Alphaproteobacteria bacterium]MBF0130429.1 (d)CMP kinase [Alphaproteobacteria bacterium]